MNIEYKIGDALDLLKELKDNSIHLVVTSPPYFLMRNEMEYESYGHYLNEMNEIFKEIKTVLKNGRTVCVNVNNYRVDGTYYSVVADFILMLQNVGLNFVDDIIWKKPDGMQTADASKRAGCFIQLEYPMTYYPNEVYEHILIFKKGLGVYKRNVFYDRSKLDWRLFKDFLSNVWEINPEHNERHPAIFPYKIPHNLISLYSFKDDVVLDPFLGSGTTLLACRKLNRNGIGFEINPDYEPLIRKRILADIPDIESFDIKEKGCKEVS